MKELILLILLCFFSCAKQNCFRNFEFHFPATITQEDTFNIGDTLWMKMDLSNYLIDHQTGESIDLKEFDMYLSLGLSKLDTLYVTGAVQYFHLVERVGSFRQERVGNFIDTYVHFRNRAEKQLHLGVVPQKKGVYSLSLGLPLEYGIAEESTDPADWIQVTSTSSCRQDIVEYSGTRFEGGCFNYYLANYYPCQRASSTDNVSICLKDSMFMAHRGGHLFVVE